MFPVNYISSEEFSSSHTHTHTRAFPLPTTLTVPGPTLEEVKKWVKDLNDWFSLGVKVSCVYGVM